MIAMSMEARRHQEIWHDIMQRIAGRDGRVMKEL